MYEVLEGQTTGVASFIDPRDTCWNAPGPILVRGTQFSYKLRRTVRQYAESFGPTFASMVTGSKSWLNKVREFARNHGTQVVLGEFLDVSHDYLSLFKEADIPFYVHAHGYDVSLRLRSAEWRKRYLEYNECKGVITMSHASRQKLIDLGLHPEKTIVVPYGVDVSESSPVRENLERKDVLKAIAVGRMVPKKGPLLLVEAIYKASREYPRIQLDYIGKGPMLDDVRRYVQDHGLGDRITLHGGANHSEVRHALKSADVFLQHSVVDPVTGDEEGLPVAVLEAMAEGLPVVATRHSGIPEEVRHGVTGYLVQEGDTEGMAARLVELAESPSLRQTMGYEGWKRVVKHFSKEQECSRLREVLGLA